MRTFLKLLVALAILALIALGLWQLLPAIRGEGEPEAGAPLAQRIESAYFTANDAFHEAAGLHWRVRSSGPADAPVLVLIHGFSHSLEDFELWADNLDDAYRIVRFDLPGHGLTGPRADEAYSNEATLEQVEALLEVIAPDRFFIGGNSLGGLLAWRYAARHPDRIDGVVLLAPGGYSINGVGDEPVAVPLPVRFYLQSAPQAGVNAATMGLFGDPERAPAGMAQRVGDLIREPGIGDALVSRLTQFTLPDPEPVLATIDDPVLIIWGDDDPMVPAEHGPRFEAVLPDAQLVILPGVGHIPQLEAPLETASNVRAFLEANAQPPSEQAP